MEDGALGLNGADAQRPVGQVYRPKNADATVQDHKMEGGNVEVLVSSHGSAKSGIVP